MLQLSTPPSKHLLYAMLALVGGLTSGCASETANEEAESAVSEATATGWKTDRKAAGTDFAALAAAADGTIYAASTGKGGPHLLARKNGKWAPIKVTWKTPFVAGASVSLLADGNDVILGAGEFYHLEAIRLQGGETTPLLKNSYSHAPALARSRSGKVLLGLGAFAVDLEGNEIDTPGTVLAFDGETLKSAGNGIWRTVGAHSIVELSPTERIIEALWLDGSGNGVAVGRGGGLFQQQAGKKTWKAVDLKVTADFHAVWGRSASEIYAVGDGGLVVQWDGSAWLKIDVGTKADLHAVSGDTEQIVIGGAGVLVRKGP